MADNGVEAKTVEFTDAEVKFIHGAVDLLWRCPNCNAGLLNDRKSAVMGHMIQGKIEQLFKETKDGKNGNGAHAHEPAPVPDGVRVAAQP